MSYRVTGEAIAEIFKIGQKIIDTKNGLPESARFYTAYFDHQHRSFICIFEDESFPQVNEFEFVQMGDLEIKKLQIISL